MTISITSSVTLLVSIVVMTMFASSYADKKITDGDVKHMCSKTDSHDQCEKLLKSTLRATNRDAKQLARAAVFLATKRALRLRVIIQTTDLKTHDIKAKKIHNSCNKDYGDVLLATRAAYNALHSGRGNVSSLALIKAYHDAKNCEKRIHKAGVDLSDMEKKNQEVELVVIVAKVTVDHLRNEKLVIRLDIVGDIDA